MTLHTRQAPRGDSSKQIRASRNQKAKEATGEVILPSKVTLQQANGVSVKNTLASPRLSNRMTQIRATSKLSEVRQREAGFVDIPKTQLALRRVPISLPTHRQDIFHFLANFSVTNPTRESSDPYASP